MTETIEEVNLMERREVRIVQWMDFNDYAIAIERCRMRFMGAQLVYPNHEAMVQGWIKGQDPAQVYVLELSRVIKETKKRVSKTIKKG